MRFFCILIINLILFSSCRDKSNKFDQVESNKFVKLSNKDFKELDKLRLLILDNLDIIIIQAKKMNAIHSGVITISPYVLKDLDKEFKTILNNIRIIEKTDRIRIKINGKKLEFGIKERFDESKLPHYVYVHKLVWTEKASFEDPNAVILKDSLVMSNWHYIYSKYQVGH